MSFHPDLRQGFFGLSSVILSEAKVAPVFAFSYFGLPDEAKGEDMAAVHEVQRPDEASVRAQE